VVQGSGFGPTSNTYTVRVDSIAPTATAQITGLTDDALGTIANGSYATDSTPNLAGTLSAAPGTGELLQVLRNGAVVGTAAVTGSNWTYAEPTALVANTYSYQVRLIDPANNLGPVSSARSFVLIGGVAGASVTSVRDDANATIAAGSVTRDATPALSGAITAALPSGTLVRVLRNGAVAGVATVSGTSWSFTDSAPEGAVSYTVRVEAGAVIGGESAAYAFSVDSIAPTQTVVVTQISDDYIGALGAGASTADQTPAISGTLSAPLAAGEQLRLRRTHAGSGTVVDQALTPAGTSWSFTESSLLATGSYTYQAQVFDAAGNTGAFSATRAVTIDLSALPLPGAAATLATVNGIAPVGGSVPLNNNNTPALAGTVARALNAGEVVRVYRNGTGVANAVVLGTSWNYTNTALADGAYSFFARVELSGNSGVFGASSSTVSTSIDATAPAQIASISGIFDDASVAVGGNNTTDTTPLINGTLNATLAVGEVVEVVRTGGAGTVTRNATVTGGTNWSLQETTPIIAAAYTYTVRVLDAAGNRGANRTLGVTVIAALPSVTSINVAYSAGLASPRTNGTVVGNFGSIADTTPTVQGSLSANLPVGASVAVYRAGTTASIGTATTTLTSWSFVDANVGQGTRAYTARVENGTAYGSTSTSYTVTVDTVAPAQTFSAITATSSVMPNTTVTGATNPNGNTISSGGTSNDASPTLRVQLSGALGSGEFLRIRRNGSEISAISSVSCGSNCFLITVAAPISIPAPPSAATGSVPTATQGYTFAVVDAAENEGTATPAFNIVFNYFACDLVRANATRQALEGLNHVTWTGATCSGCHSASSATSPTPAGTMVAVPSSSPPYWCRRP
jgi:hypothetical protein